MDDVKIIFLDIDGVIQPYNANKRFYVNRQELINYLSKKYNIDYSMYDEYDVAAVYYDWDKNAINIIKDILNQTNSKIVISSSWKSSILPNKMKDFLTIHELDPYYLDDTKDIMNITNYQELKKYSYRVIEILDYLERNNNISNYVAIDDLDLSYGLENHFVKTKNIITPENGKECIKILKRKKYN